MLSLSCMIHHMIRHEVVNPLKTFYLNVQLSETKQPEKFHMQDQNR